jgi:5'-deoxynucleotidase YfbR-like HD superfamily hydrolase
MVATLNDIKYYSQIYKLRFITRYSNVERVRDEDVAQHSFFTAAIVMQLREEYLFNLGQALQMAVCHDMIESFTGDMSHSLKVLYPAFSSAVDQIEYDASIKLPIHVAVALEMFQGDSIEAKIVRLADAIQVYQYTESEIRLGNSGEISEINKKVKERIFQLRGLCEYAKTRPFN